MPADGLQFTIDSNLTRSQKLLVRDQIIAVDSVRYKASEKGGDTYRYGNGIANSQDGKGVDSPAPPAEFDEVGSLIRPCPHTRPSPFKSDMLCNV